jgi:hypothetical protein
LQPKVVNGFEYKVAILTNDVPGSPNFGETMKPFRVFCEQPIRDRTKNATDEEVTSFAQEVYNAYVQRMGKRLQIGPICRIDMFTTQSGRLVVNEIEGLEANIHPLQDRLLRKAGTIRAFLETYWCDVIVACIEKCRQRDSDKI